VHELNRKAVSEKLILNKRNFFAKTEFTTQSQRRKLLELERKFEVADAFEDDTAIPPQTVIYFSVRHNLIGFGIGILLAVTGFYWVFAREQYWMALFFLAGDYLAIHRYRKMRNRKPQLLIAETGIRHADGPFVPWKSITEIDVSNNLLLYTLADSSRHVVDLAELDMKVSRIRNRIHFYIGRYEHFEKANRNA
jgi:hypothetical protein